ncbi:MAG: long-chain fatty acid--CoA ligase, partial [Ilumatobacteraceae bacterium]
MNRPPTITKQGRPARLEPFDMTDIVRGTDGVLRYAGLPASLVAMLADVAQRRADDEAVVQLGGPRLTYSDLWRRAARVAGGLRDRGVGRGDRVALAMPNGVDWVCAFFGTLLAGAVVVPVNIRLAPAEVAYVVGDCGAEVVITPELPLPDGEPYSAMDVGLNDLAAIFYTSGTTGFPKGAMILHENFLATCETRGRVTGTANESQLRNLVSVPLFHVTGCISQLLFTVYRGGTTVIMPTFDVQRFLQAIEAERINICTSVPAIYWLALNQPNFAEFDVSGVRHLSYGGAPMAPAVVAAVRKAFPNARLGNGFGLTETSAICTFLPDRWCDSRPESVGFAAPVVELDLADPDPLSGVGELVARGQNIVAGYWNDPARTAETFRDRWLHTGDLALLDDDG